MCGIIFGLDHKPIDHVLEAMHIAQAHRGPDSGTVKFERAGDAYLGFTHERLAIYDLTERGAQPMESASGRHLIIFNGEIYNFQELAKTYGLKNLKSNSDTEVVVELIEKIGLTEASRAFNGMWAIVVYDRKTGKIHLSRDRFGKKPLHIARTATGIFLSSEMFPLLNHPDISRKPNVAVAARFLVQSIQNADEQTWLQGVTQLPMATVATIDVATDGFPMSTPEKFWEPSFTPDVERSEAEWISHLHETVSDAVRLRLHADVPVGIALSGGIDSTVIAAIAAKQAQQERPIQLFSATSRGSVDDESAFIDIAEKALKVDVQRYDLQLDQSEDVFASLQNCIQHNDGPIASFAPVLFHKLMGMAKASGVTVVLTGQGADEAFCGYRKYPFFEIKRLLKNGNLIAATRLASAFGLRGTLFNGFKFSEAKRYISSAKTTVLGDRARDADALLSLQSGNDMAQRQWRDISALSVPYLCHYEDRMSMAQSREVRAPFLDYRVIEMGLQMPTSLKLQKGWTKYALRHAFASELPSQIAWRKDKKGFVNPQDDLMRGPLKPIVLEVMSDRSAAIYTEGLVNPDAYLDMFKRYCAGDNRIWFREVFAPFATAIWLQLSQNKAPV